MTSSTRLRWRSPTPSTGRPSSSTTMSPSRTPAVAAGGLEQLDDLEAARPADCRRRALAAAGSRRRSRGTRAGRGRRASGSRGWRGSPRRSGPRDPRPTPATAVLMPTTRPRESASAPPELPGLSAASVWMTFSTSRLRRAVAGRERPAERADDARRHGAGEAERIADRDDELPDLEPGRVAERCRPGRRRRRGRPRDRRAGRGPTTRNARSAPSTNVAVPLSVPATTCADVTR